MSFARTQRSLLPGFGLSLGFTVAYLGLIVLVPLSAFDPASIPARSGCEVVFACRSGRRSVTASLAAQEQGFAYGSHLAGGILAWKAAGLPTET